jgi:hypothetical protein
VGVTGCRSRRSIAVVFLLLVVVGLLVWGAHAVCGRFHSGLVRFSVEMTVISLLGTMITYALGILSAFNWPEPCGELPVEHIEYELLPMREICVSPDGSRHEQVAGFVNPLLFAFLGLSATGMVLLLVTAARDAFVRSSATGPARP